MRYHSSVIAVTNCDVVQMTPLLCVKLNAASSRMSQKTR